MRVYSIKKFEVVLERYGLPDWMLIVTANSSTKSIAIAYTHYIREGYSPDDVTDIRTKRSDSHL